MKPAALRAALLSLIAVLLFALPTHAHAQDDESSVPVPQPKGLIAGTVVRGDSNTPLADAAVTLHDRSKHEVNDIVQFTEGDGKFSFASLPPGTYTLIASRPRFAMPSNSLQTVGLWFTIGNDQQITDIVLTLVPGGVVYGKVLDDLGEPLVNSTVELLAPKYGRSATRFKAVDSVAVNDLGDFRIFGIPPGRYYLVAVPPGATAEHWDRDRAAREARPTNFRRMFYDSALAEANAHPLQITAGSETPVTFRLPRVATASVRLNFTLPKEFQATSGYAGMVPVDSIMEEALVYTSIKDNVTTSVFNGVIPGRYYVGAILEAPSDDEDAKERAALCVQEFDITEGVNEIQVPVTYLATRITGHVRFDSNTHPPAESLRVRAIALRGEFTLFEEGLEDSVGDIQRSGDFKMGTISAIRTALQLEGRKIDWNNYYLKSVLVGGREALTTGIVAGTRGARVELLVASDGGTISGIVVDNLDHPIHNSAVAALPDAEHRKTYACMRSDYTDEFGRFSLPGLCPGQYTVLALPLEAPLNVYYDPEFVKSHESLGVPVEVKPSSHQSIEIHPITMQSY